MKKLLFLVTGLLLTAVMVTPLLAQQGAETIPCGLKEHKFLSAVGENLLAEEAFGKLGVEKASNSEVKKYAQMMIDDHRGLYDELNDVARKRGAHCLPMNLDKESQAQIDRLSKLSGEEFDRAFINVMVRLNKRDVWDFREQAENGGTDTFLQGWAIKMQPRMDRDLRTAMALQEKIGRE
jgi:putative membrane protein